mgnify:CR=1 FL=1
MAQLKIENGPGKFELMIALFTRGPQSKIRLTVIREPSGRQDELGRKLDEVYGGSKEESYILQGMSKAPDSADDWNIVVVTPPGPFNRYILKGRYSTKTRKGFLEVPGTEEKAA